MRAPVIFPAWPGNSYLPSPATTQGMLRPWLIISRSPDTGAIVRGWYLNACLCRQSLIGMRCVCRMRCTSFTTWCDRFALSWDDYQLGRKMSGDRSASIFVADHLRSAAKKAGVVIENAQRFGLQNLRHSLSNWLVNKAKVEPKPVQGILRHAKVQTTLDLYTQEDSDETRAAQGQFLEAVMTSGGLQ